MDDADRATDLQEAELDAIIAAARGIKPKPAARCRECDEDLPEYRRPYGTCYLCQDRLEFETLARRHRGTRL